MRLGRHLIVAAALLARAGIAGGAWLMSADGTCVEQWSSSDLLRGPAVTLVSGGWGMVEDLWCIGTGVAAPPPTENQCSRPLGATGAAVPPRCGG